MKFTLKSGAELDLLTADEMRQILAQHRAEREEVPERPMVSGVTDGTGAILLTLYEVPLGREFVLTRLVIDADGFNPGAPFKNGVGWIDVLREGVRVDFVNLQNGIPALSVDSKETANRFRNGEKVQVQIVGGPANTNIRVSGLGMLRGTQIEHRG